MKSACCLLLLLTLAPSYQAIRCLCDETTCVGGSGPEEDCPNRLSEDYFKNNPNYMVPLHSMMTMLRYSSDVSNAKLRGAAPSGTQGSEEMLANSTSKANEFYKSLTSKEKATFFEAVYDIFVAVKADREAGSEPEAEVFKMVDRAFAKTYEPKAVDNQFCYKFVDKNKKTHRSCGVMGVAVGLLGPITEDGCHESAAFGADSNSVEKYCRCGTDGCNSGDVEAESSNAASKNASKWVSSSLVVLGFMNYLLLVLF